MSRPGPGTCGEPGPYDARRLMDTADGGRHRAAEPPPEPPPEPVPAPRRWATRPAVLRVIAVAAAVGILAPPLVLAAQAAAPKGLPATALVLPTPEQREPTGRASGVRLPTRTTTPPAMSTSTTATPSSTPTGTRACRCAPRSPAAPETSSPSPTSAASSSTVVAEEEAKPTADPQPAADVGLLELVNADRAAAGCGPVAPSASLAGQSQAHAERQAADDAMYHSAGVTGFDTWGENVAAGYDTAAAVHDAWMASTGHRANILNCAYVYMGAGAADSAAGVRYWTEQFAA